MTDFDVAVIGSGFAGSIVARIARRLGLRVALVERRRHPRFALGESSTPLAAISLERLAHRWELPELREMAAWGRWVESLPELRRGLKRGFTFYAHRPGEPFVVDSGNRNRLLVAASPSDAVADSHWLREDVDGYLARLAAADGAELVEETAVGAVSGGPGAWRLELEDPMGKRTIGARFVVDASGAGGVMARALGLRSVDSALRSGLVYGHFSGVPDFAELMAAAGSPLPPGPYPDGRAAVHHLLDGAWVYILPFDHGVVSAGAVLLDDPPGPWSGAIATGEAPESVWRRVLAAYPSLIKAFAGAEAVREPQAIQRMQRRVSLAAGPGWALLPHAFAFSDPLFSTGIAWSLLGVERLADALDGALTNGRLDVERLGVPLVRYASALGREAERVESLLRSAYLALADFPSFVELSYLYFAAVSFAETAQRLRGPGDREAAWEGFLGADDPVVSAGFAGARSRLERLPGLGRGERRELRQELAAFVAEAIRPRNVAGLADPGKRHLYGVDLELLVERAALLGLTPEAMGEALPRLLRG